MSDSNNELVLPDDFQDYKVASLPIIANFCQKIGITELVDQKVDSPENISSGQVVVGMIMDTLCGRSPLYKLHEFFIGQDTELLFGSKLKSSDFNDNNVGKVLDNIHGIGTSQLFSQIAWQACQSYDLDCKHLHYDTTSISVHGDYPGYEAETDEHIAITHGYSKDHRPDLKQFMMEAVCVQGNVPILGAALSGNTSDKKANNKELTAIASFIRRNGIDASATTYIADSALVSEENLQKLQGQAFITRLPGTYSVEKQIIDQAFEADQWQQIGVLAEEPDPCSTRPSARYKLWEGNVKLYEHNYRAIVVHSSAHDKRRLKKLTKTLEKEKKQYRELTRELDRTFFYCSKDAQQYCNTLLQKHRFDYHDLVLQIQEHKCYAKGRPRKDQPREVKEIHYCLEGQLLEKSEKIEALREKSGCFVLISNLPQKGHNAHSGKEILKAYKEQYGIEMNFRFLKDPLIVNDTFLKKAERIEALGFILLLSLMVWNLIQHVLREHLKKHGKTILGWDNKQTGKPTPLMVIFYFQHISIFMWDKGRKRRLSRKLKDHQKDYLMALRLPQSIFTTPVKTFRTRV